MRVLVIALLGITVLLAGCGSDGETADTTTTTTASQPAADATTTTVADFEKEIRVEVAEGEVVGGVQRVSVRLGDHVRIEVVADVADDVHLHGYDRFAAISPPEAAVLEFDADIPGVFEVELEDAGLLLVELEVS